MEKERGERVVVPLRPGKPQHESETYRRFLVLSRMALMAYPSLITIAVADLVSRTSSNIQHPSHTNRNSRRYLATGELWNNEVFDKSHRLYVRHVGRRDILRKY